jgi:hypothetical protein
MSYASKIITNYIFFALLLSGKVHCKADKELLYLTKPSTEKSVECEESSLELLQAVNNHSSLLDFTIEGTASDVAEGSQDNTIKEDDLSSSLHIPTFTGTVNVSGLPEDSSAMVL